ncbi:MAG: hypothetical protein A3F11_02410 [Gammaproteobacteria bacterium RIFCSPHIGHO2_12_FULL_37_14]|nr:MAG: hypothetical protein A3F11_02410 [Gammaproteobacteria bacterium RIFCSPHIGHO2_12_FULL_37_14]
MGDQSYNYINITINGESYAFNSTNRHLFPAKNANVQIYTNTHQLSCSLELDDIGKEKIKLFESTNKNTQVNFYFYEDKTSITLPSEMTANLVGFFKNYKPESKPDYCCINFAYELAYGRDVVKEDNSLDYFQLHDAQPFCEEQLIPGDIVFLYKDPPTYLPFHFAIYISHQSYLSLFGTIGPMIISTLDDMKYGFQVDTCVKVSKKHMTNTTEINPPAINKKTEKQSQKNIIKHGLFATTSIVASALTSKYLAPWMTRKRFNA